MKYYYVTKITDTRHIRDLVYAVYLLYSHIVQVRLHELQIDPTTYSSNPTPEERYQEWLSTFDLEGSKGAISELLVSNVEVRALYTQLVSIDVQVV
jgi:hypothetical protein